jgi:hypothetical protein
MPLLHGETLYMSVNFDDIETEILSKSTILGISNVGTTDKWVTILIQHPPWTERWQ